MSIDKTYSELWGISDHEDEAVREVVEMAINTLQKMDAENIKLRAKLRDIKTFINTVSIT